MVNEDDQGKVHVEKHETATKTRIMGHDGAAVGVAPANIERLCPRPLRRPVCLNHRMHQMALHAPH